MEKLKELTVLLNEDADEHEPLHLLLCSRDDQAITDYFDICLMIATSPIGSNEDQTFYIRSEIERMSRLKPGSLFFLSEKRYPDRLEKILMKKAEGLFRWTQIQIQKFTKRFRDESEIEDEFEWFESHTTHPELNKEYARLLDSLGGSGRTKQRAIKMLRLISSSFVPLSVENLADAITASEHGMNCEQLKADDVRRILVGFITEIPIGQYVAHLYASKYLIRLAHSSVIEYLADAQFSAEDFSRLTLHSEAAQLCFSSLIQGRQGEAPGLSAIESSTYFSMAFGDDFFGYSCNYWHLHCRKAFMKDSTCALVQDASKFILSEGYLTWNRAVREHCDFRSPNAFLQWKDSFYSSSSYERPGFVIPYFGLLGLLEIPGICSIVDLQGENSQGTSLLFFALNLIRNRSITDCFMELYQNKVTWIDEVRIDLLAAGKNGLKVVRRLPGSGQGNFTRDENGLTALHWAVLIYCLPSRTSPVELDSLILIIEFLLKKGANIYDADNYGRSAMHYAYRRNAQDLLIKHAKEWERRAEMVLFRYF